MVALRDTDRNSKRTKQEDLIVDSNLTRLQLSEAFTERVQIFKFYCTVLKIR